MHASSRVREGEEDEGDRYYLNGSEGVIIRTRGHVLHACLVEQHLAKQLARLELERVRTCVFKGM